MTKKIKSYQEAELIEMFGLTRLSGNNKLPLMQEWTDTSTTLEEWEQHLYNNITDNLSDKIVGWNEETLKMNFIAFVLLLGHIDETHEYKKFYEETIEATIAGHFLKVKTDMMVAKGILDKPKMPYLYFQEYKRMKDPNGDVTAQLLEALLIAQEKNQTGKPIYGCTISGKSWDFMILTGATYCLSKTYDCTETEGLMQIIAILRKFKWILETRLLLD
jgi:hypothetical protein